MKKIYKLLTAGMIIPAIQSANAQCPVPTSVTATPSVICAGSTTSLNATSAGSSIMWYTVPTCGVPTGTSASGANFSVSPVVTTTYYAQSFAPAIAGGTSTFNYVGGCPQQVVIPVGVSQITIEARGAQGGNSPGNSALGGNGARMIGTFTVTPGQILNILVGQQGITKPNDNGNNYGGGGGGGSFVWTNSVNPMVAAGGGGGAWQTTAGGAGLMTTSAGPSSNGAAGGVGGNGGGATGSCGAAGGGGWFTSGTNSSCFGYAPQLQGGGTYSTFVAGICTAPCNAGGTNYGTNGGFGGGASCWHGGGGGGGYSGGGGGNNSSGNGGGGGSYNGGTNPSNVSNFQTGNGLVIITGISGGCISAARTPVTVSVVPSPTVAIAGGTAAICAGSSVTLTASGAASYTWSNGAFTSTIAPTPTANITYSVVGSNGGCAGTAVKNITVSPVPTVAVSGSTLICGTGTNILTANGADTYSWSTGALTASISASPSVTTNYTVIGTNTLGNCTSTQTLALVVSTNPTIAVAGTLVICNGQTTTLTASGANTYSWNNGAVTAAVALSPTATTAYTVVGTNTAGCAGANMQTVTVNPSPTVSVVGGQTICVGVQSASLSASGANTYSWSNGATTSSIVVSPSVTTTYTAIGTSSVNGCTGINTAIVTVDPCTGLSGNNPAFKGLSVYPNPGNGDFTIELKNGLIKTIVVTDYTGKVVFTSTSSKDLIHINLSSLANGIYNVKIESNNSTEVLKVVKQ